MVAVVVVVDVVLVDVVVVDVVVESISEVCSMAWLQPCM